MAQKRNRESDIYADLGKCPPSALDLEETLLGSVLLIESLDFCIKTIKAEEFYKDVHIRIYQIMEELHNLKQPITVESVCYLLKKKQQLDLVGGPYYISQLTNGAMAVPSKIDFYAKIIHQTFINRELIRMAQDIMDKAFDPNIDVSDIMEEVLNTIDKLEQVNIYNMPELLHYERVFIKGMITNSTIFLEYKSIVPDDLFVDKVHQKLWSILRLLSDNGIEITLFAVEDVLNESKNTSAVSYIKEIVEMEHREDLSFEYLFVYLKKYYEKMQIHKMTEYLKENRFAKEPEEIIDRIDKYLDNIRTKEIQIVNFNAHLDSTYTDIISKSKDGNRNILKTGFNKVDTVAMFSTNDIVIVGGARGSGKTRLVLKFVEGILTLNEDCAACLICMEETVEKIVRVFLSIITELTDGQLQSKYYNLKPEDKISISDAKTILKKLDIEIVAHPVSIKQANAIFSKFAKKKKNKRCIFMLDNLMLLEDTTSKVDADDMIAKQLVYIKKKTGALFFVLHHFTKEQESFANAVEAYRPKEGHLKGSTRYTDIADHVILLNKVGKYHDLVKQESLKPPIKIYDEEKKKEVSVKRDKILSKLIITEITKNRDGTDDEKLRIIRFFADLGTMKIKEWR
jgi:replicative DNA helicase